MNSDWQTENEDSDGGGSSDSPRVAKKRKKGLKQVKTKRRRVEQRDSEAPLNWSGTNTRTLISQIQGNRDLFHDFTKVIDAKITGRELKLDELRTAGNVISTRSKLPGQAVLEQQIQIERDQKENSVQHNVSTPMKPSYPHLMMTTTVRRTSRARGSRGLRLLRRFIRLLPIHEQDSCLSQVSAKSDVQIAKKLAQKWLSWPIENIVQKFSFPDLKDIPAEPLNWDQDYFSFLNDTFGQQIEHQEEDPEDDDFNPNEFVDELLDSTGMKSSLELSHGRSNAICSTMLLKCCTRNRWFN